MFDVLVVGAGPAGSVAATLLARAGARVLLVDRARFPRDKLCGDTVNPGTVALLRRLEMARGLDARGLRVDGMRVTGARGDSVVGLYGGGQHGRAMVRRELDWMLLQDALAAGAEFEPGVGVGGPIVDGEKVAGARTRDDRMFRARVTIAADGRRSPLAFGLGLARHPARPRRWAIGGYFEGVGGGGGNGVIGEMHIRRGRYIGVADVPGGLTNVCLVRSFSPDERLGNPTSLMREELSRDAWLRDRFEQASLVAAPAVLGPLAVEVRPAAIDGLLLAGDAAGFIDPMTGDGLRLAIRGAELAAASALEALQHGWQGVSARLAARRRSDLAAKWRFNRLLRAVVGSPPAVDAATLGARAVPALLRAVIRYAGDCPPVPAGGAP